MPNRIQILQWCMRLQNNILNLETCDFTCLTCSSGYCGSCDPADHRTLSNGSCVCLSGYYEYGLKRCISNSLFSCMDASLNTTITIAPNTLTSDIPGTSPLYSSGTNSVSATFNVSGYVVSLTEVTSSTSIPLNTVFTNFANGAYVSAIISVIQNSLTQNSLIYTIIQTNQQSLTYTMSVTGL